MTETRAAAIYARISSDQDGRGLGVQRQVADCRKLAKERGWAVAEEYVDNDISAFSGKARPAYERMLADLADGVRDAVIVYNLDRLHRRPIELEEFAAVCAAAGMTNLATVTQDIDLGNDDGLFMARLYAAVAAKESGRRPARVKRKMEANAAAGLPHGENLRPFGYDKTRMIVNETEAVVIRELVSRVLAGESVRSIATWLADERVSTVTGKPWRTTSVRALIAAPRIAGLREYNGVVVAPAAYWPAIITEEQHHRVVAKMTQNAATGRRNPRRYLLSGMLRCGKCGGKLYSSARQSSRRYVCLGGPDHEGCGRLTVVAEPVETFLAAAVLYRLDTPELADALAGRAAKDAALDAISGQLADDQDQLRELATAYGDKQFTLREWMDARKPIEARIEQAQRRISRATHSDALSGLPGNGAALKQSWADLNLTRQAAIIAAVLDHASIKAGVNGARLVDHNRIVPTWRI